MKLSAAQSERARYVRTVLAWHDVTQADLAQILGITPQAANRKIKGLRAFKDDELLAIAEAFELDPGHLLRPPELTPVLGAVRNAAPDLLTWPYRQHRRSAAYFAPRNYVVNAVFRPFVASGSPFVSRRFADVAA